MGGRDHSCEVCGRGGFNDPNGSCICLPADPPELVEAVEKAGDALTDYFGGCASEDCLRCGEGGKAYCENPGEECKQFRPWDDAAKVAIEALSGHVLVLSEESLKKIRHGLVDAELLNAANAALTTRREKPRTVEEAESSPVSEGPFGI